MLRHHIVFIEDDESEMATFRRLYEGDQFELTGLCIQFPRSVVPALAEALGDRVPDLFVLDLFFPAVSNPPGGFTVDTVGDARAHLTRVLRAAEELEGMFIDESALEKNDKELLRAGSELVYWSQRMLRHWPSTSHQWRHRTHADPAGAIPGRAGRVLLAQGNGGRRQGRA